MVLPRDRSRYALWQSAGVFVRRAIDDALLFEMPLDRSEASGVPDGAAPLAFSADGETLAAGMLILRGRAPSLLAGPEVRVTDSGGYGVLALSHDGRLLAEADRDLLVYDVPKKRWRLRTWLRQDDELLARRFSSIAFSPDARFFAVSTPSRYLALWNVEVKANVMWSDIELGVRQVGFSLGGRRVFWCSEDGSIGIADTEHGTKLGVIELIDEAATITLGANGMLGFAGDSAMLEDRLACKAGPLELPLEVCAERATRPRLALEILKGDDAWLLP